MKPEDMTDKEYHECMKAEAVWQATCTVRAAIDAGGVEEVIKALGPKAKKVIAEAVR